MESLGNAVGFRCAGIPLVGPPTTESLITDVSFGSDGLLLGLLGFYMAVYTFPKRNNIIFHSSISAKICCFLETFYLTKFPNNRYI
jgi:hypothetical protein